MFSIPPPLIRRKKRRPFPKPKFPPPAVAFALQSATYSSGTSVTLVFTQAIDINAFQPSELLVSDGSGTGYLWVGMNAALTSANVVVVELELFESASAGPALLTANPSNGIVSASDGTPWGGALNLPLPYEMA